MEKTFDQSHLNNKYFIDEYKYNCPFCNRNSITYKIVGRYSFDWSQERKVYGYLVRCGGDECGGESMHLSNYVFYSDNEHFHSIKGEVMDNKNLDQYFFYHQPTSFFTLDDRIDKKIRSLISEAEGCKKMGYLVGASGCLRKTIYEFLEKEKLESIGGKKWEDANYEEKIKELKKKYPNIPVEYFDALSNIQDMTSKNLHEGSWKPWTQSEFDYLIEIVKEVLSEIYVNPEEKKTILQKILLLKPVPEKQ